MKLSILFIVLFPLLCLSQNTSKKQLIQERGFIVFTDASYYFIPYKGIRLTSLQHDFKSENLGIGFDIDHVKKHTNLDSLMQKAQLFRKTNFPDSLPEAYNSISIFPFLTNITYERSNYDILHSQSPVHYIADIMGRRVEYDYDFRNHIIIDIIPIKE